MIRTLLATTALAAVLATGALAQDASSSMDSSSMMDMSSSMDSSSMMDSSMMDTSSSMMDTSSSEMAMPSPRQPVDIISGYTRVDTDRLATKIIGQPVFDSPATDANNLGNINDLVLDQNGQIAAVVLGVGGFLGIGEKQVAVDYTALQWVVAADNTERFVLETTVDQLTQAPDFTTVDDNPADGDAMMSDDMMSSSSAAQ